MTVNSNGGEKQDCARQAAVFLKQLRDQRSSGKPLSADDLLLFLYRLRDGYRIVRSASGRFKGPSLGFLNELLYQLESRPDETLESPEWREFTESFLYEVASGRVILKQNADHR